MKIKVAIVEDDDALRQSLALVISGAPGFECVGDYSSAERALRSIPSVSPDVVLMDINLPDRSGIDCVRELKARLPRLNILMMTIEQDSSQVFKALEAGATGYLVKDVPYAKLLEAVAELHSGGAPMSGPIARMMIQHFTRQARQQKELESLTPREAEILEWLAKGFTDKEIASQLGCQPRTIAAHCHNIYEKLHVHSRAAAVARYLKG